MRSDHFVSIVTPAYRCAGVVSQTIESVLKQSHANWEMLIAEDCSPDNSREVIESWARREPRIKLIPMAQNGGPALARNAALERAQGRWLAFLDSDDLWMPEKLQRSLEFASEHDAAFVFTGFRRFNTDSEAPGRYIGVPRTLSYRQLLGNTAIATSTVVLDTRKVGSFRMKQTYYDDFDCWLQILKRGIVAHGLDEDLMRYRIMGQSVSRNKRKSAMQVWRAYRDLEKLGVPSSAWYFTQYAVRGLLKYRGR